METNVKIKSFKEALLHFVELCDNQFQPEDTVRVFAEMKEKGFFEYANEKEFWRGNHDSGQRINRIYLIDNPLRFYVVESSYIENSCDFQGTRTERWVYVPEK